MIRLKFGTKASEVDDSDSDGLYLRNFKDGDTKVRFLEEWPEWIEFREHYNANKRSYPCTQDKETCPGCNSDSEDEARASRKYATNLLVVKGNFVAPFRVPVGLKKKMEARAERNEGTILNRDYIVMKSGKFLETEYDVEGDDKYQVDVKKLLKDALDIEEILQKSFAENAPGQVKEQKSSGLARGRKNEDDSDEVVPRSARRKVEEDEEEFPTKPERPVAEDDSEEDLVIDEDELMEMNISDLKALAAKIGVDVPSTARKSSIIRLLLETAA